jgi:hypothetical protein
LAGHRWASDDALIDRWNFDSSLAGERGTTLPSTATYIDGPGHSGTANVVQIKGTWAANTTLNCFVLCRTNLTSSSTMRLRIYSDTGYTTELYDSNDGSLKSEISGSRTGDYINVAWYFSTLTTARSFQLEINNGTTAVDIARIVAGNAWSPGRNAEVGVQLAWPETGTRSRTEGGALIVDQGAVFRALSVRLGRITADERASVSALLYALGTTREAFVSLYPQELNSQREIDYSLCGYLSAPPLVHPVYGNYTVDLTIEES